MQLELKAESTGIVPRSSRWALERGRRTIGRSPECDWQLPEDERSVSKVHCLIERKGDSYILEDRSSNGSVVDGVWLHDGATAPLRDDSRIALGKLSFRVSIHGEQGARQADPDEKLALSSETLTISSILSDIVPAGQMASGVLGPREADDPFAFIQPPKVSASSSRNVDIGWNGPPQPEKHGKLLPENWWEEAEDDTSFGHALEHAPATRVAVHVSRAGVDLGATEPQGGNPVPEPESEAVPIAEALEASQYEVLLRQLEQAMEQASATLQLPAQTHIDDQPFVETTGDPMLRRLQAILAQQVRVNEALERMFSGSSRLFDPRILEARSETQEKLGFAWLKEASYWRYYRAQFEHGGRALSVADLLRKTYLTQQSDDTDGATAASEEGKRPDEV